MDPVTFFSVVTAVVFGGFWVHFSCKSKTIKGYNPHYVRKLEAENRVGGAVTVCGNEKCKECNPGLVELPAPKLKKCSTCKVPLDDDGWCSNGCVRMQPHTLKPKRGEIIFNAKWLRYECSTCNLKFTDDAAKKHKTCPDCTATDCISCGVKLPKGIHRSTCRKCNMLDSKHRNDPRYKGYRQQDIEFQRWVRELAAQKAKFKGLQGELEKVKREQVPYRERPCSDRAGHELAMCPCEVINNGS